MSITYKGLRNGGWSQDKDGNVTSSIVWVYHFNGSENAVQIAQQTGLPQIGDPHPNDATLTVSGVSVSEPMEGDGVKSGKYEVTISYARATNSTQFDTNDRTVAPWNRPPYDLSITPVDVVKAFQKGYQDGDTNGNPSKPVLNPAGDPYEDSTAERHTVIRFSYNLETFRPQWIGQYVDSINVAAVGVVDIGINARRGCIRNLSASQVKEYDNEGVLTYTYWKVDVEIEVARTEWKREILARGLYAKDATSKYRIYFRNDGATGAARGRADVLGTDPIPAEEPQLLMATGYLLADGGTPVYDTYYDKFTSNWAALSLPGSTLE